jgi:hypothetical protein
MAMKLFESIGFRVEIEAVDHSGGRVVVCHIPSRPRGTAYHVDGKYLMRAGESLVPMSEDRLRQIFAEGAPDWLEEHSKTGIIAGIRRLGGILLARRLQACSALARFG